LDKDIQFNARVTETVWDDELGKWKVEVDQAGTIIHDEADILVNASGFLK
jgi:cation diffusion facilitator CzcD-associated flavoprotein CzcO